MMKRSLLSALLFVCLSLVAASQPQEVQVQQFVLDNGMRVWLNVDHSQPKVFGAVVVNAGAVDCPDTGIAHYFEHILFKGTDELGTVDYAAERVYLDSISMKYDELARTADDKRRKAIQYDINELNIKASQYAIPNEFNRLITKYGGSDLNAGTSYDFTYYHNTFAGRCQRVGGAQRRVRRGGVRAVRDHGQRHERRAHGAVAPGVDGGRRLPDRRAGHGDRARGRGA